MRALACTSLVAALAASACASDPQYIPGPAAIEVGVDTGDPTMPPSTVATASVTLPIKPETMPAMLERQARETELGIELAYVRLGDLDVSIEWTVKNLAMAEAGVKVKIDGGNQFFYYVPLNFVIDPDEDETPPSLAGGIPMRVPAGGTLSGVVREDQLREASLDLEAISRGMVNPFAAMFNINEDDPTVLVAGVPVPQDAVSQMIRYDISVEADQHVVLEYTLRVRDQRGILHEQLLAAPATDIVTFTPAEYIPPPPPAP
ncbi:MAG: hypothetical protein IPL61_10390 [Myxococcales bacterium]|nr:hypothetical protein [Myxococcales bacterium]